MTVLAQNLGPIETTHEVAYTDWWRLSDEEKREYVATVKASLLIEVQKRHPDMLYAFGEPEIEMPNGGLTVANDKTLQRMVRITCHVFVFQPLVLEPDSAPEH